MSEQQLDCALDLMRRLPPQQIEKNLSQVSHLTTLVCITRVVGKGPQNVRSYRSEQEMSPYENRFKTSVLVDALSMYMA